MGDTRDDGRHALAQKPPTVKACDLALLSIPQLEELLEQEKDYNQSLPSGDELRVFFESLSNDQLHLYVDALQQRLSAETELLDRFARLGLDPFAADLAQAELPFPVRRVPREQAPDGAAGLVNAYYRNGAIHVVAEPPTLAKRLTLLASRGIIGNDIFHEVFHGLQDGVDMYHSLEDVLGAIEADDGDQARVALAEAHAWLSCLPGFKQEVLADVIGASYRIDRSEHLEAAFELLYGLAVLGLSDEEIGRLVGAARWCETRGGYVELLDERERLLARSGLSREELDQQVERRKLIERIQALRAVGIARELVQAMQYSLAVENVTATT